LLVAHALESKEGHCSALSRLLPNEALLVALVDILGHDGIEPSDHPRIPPSIRIQDLGSDNSRCIIHDKSVLRLSQVTTATQQCHAGKGSKHHSSRVFAHRLVSLQGFTWPKSPSRECGVSPLRIVVVSVVSL